MKFQLLVSAFLFCIATVFFQPEAYAKRTLVTPLQFSPAKTALTRLYFSHCKVVKEGTSLVVLVGKSGCIVYFAPERVLKMSGITKIAFRGVAKRNQACRTVPDVSISVGYWIRFWMRYPYTPKTPYKKYKKQLFYMAGGIVPYSAKQIRYMRLARKCHNWKRKKRRK